MIREICRQQDMTLSELARRLGQSRQNLFKKMKNNTLSHEELSNIAEILHLEYNQGFTMPDGKQMNIVVEGENEVVEPCDEGDTPAAYCEEMVLLNPFTHSVRKLIQSSSAAVDEYFGTDDFGTRSFEQIMDRIHPDDRKAYLNILSWDGIRSILRNERNFHLYFRIKNGTGYEHKVLYLTRIDNDEQSGVYEVAACVNKRASAQVNAKKVSELLENRMRFMRMIADFAASLIGSSENDDTAWKLVGSVCRYYLGECSYIAQVDGENSSPDFGYPQNDTLYDSKTQSILRYYPIFAEMLSEEDTLYVSENSGASETDDEFGGILRENGLSSLLLSAIKEKGRITDVWVIENPRVNTDDLITFASCTRLMEAFCLRKKRIIQEAEKKEPEPAALHDVPDVLASEFTSVFYINLVKSAFFVYSMDQNTKNAVGDDFSGISYSEAYRRYVEKMVIPEDRQMMLKAGSVGNILAELRKKKTFSVMYRSLIRGEVHYCEMKIILQSDHKAVPESIVMAFSDRDIELRARIESEKKNQQDNEIIKILVSEYSSVYYVDLLTQEISVYTLEAGADEKLGGFLRSKVTYTEAYKLCVDSFVYPEDREMMRRAGSIYNVINELENKKTYSVVYRAMSPDGPRYSEMRFVKVGNSPDPQAVALGFADRHEEYMIKKKEKSNLILRVHLAETVNRCLELLLASEEIQKGIREVLRVLCEYYSCRHACVFEADVSGNAVRLSCLYGPDEENRLKEAFESVPMTEFTGWWREHVQNDIVSVRLPEINDQSDRRAMLLSEQGIRSVLVSSSFRNQTLHSFLAIDAEKIEPDNYDMIKQIAHTIDMALVKNEEKSEEPGLVKPYVF